MVPSLYFAQMKGVLGRYFDAVFIISLEARVDRRERLSQELRELGLADPKEIRWIRAVSGEQCWAPGFFAAGRGAWGCLQSHLRVFQDAIMDGLETVLVMEDDATFHRRTEEMLDLFFKHLPADWDQVFQWRIGARFCIPIYGCFGVERSGSF